MAVVVVGVAVVVVEVPPIDIVDIPIAIIILTVACDFTRVRPCVACKVLMVVVHAGVNHTDHEVLVASVVVPCKVGANLWHAVELAITWVVGDRLKCMDDVDGFDILQHVITLSKDCQCIGNWESGIDAYEPWYQPEGLANGAANLAKQVFAGEFRKVRLEPQEQCIGHVFMGQGVVIRDE